MEPLKIPMPLPTEPLKPGLNIRINLENVDTIEVIDNTELPENFKKDILSPYLRHLYDDLASRGANPAVGIPKTTFLEVLIFHHAHIKPCVVSEYGWIDRG